MTDISIIDMLIERIRLEYTDYWVQSREPEPAPWKINVKNIEYVLIRKHNNIFIFERALKDLWVTCTLQEIHSAFKESNINYVYELKIRNFINEMIFHTNMKKQLDILENHVAASELKNNMLEKKLDTIEDKLSILISALDLQNQNASNKI